MPFETIAGTVATPGATITALTALTGDSFTVRKSDAPKLLNAWSLPVAAGVLRIRSVLMHDNTQGLRQQTITGLAEHYLAVGTYQPLQSQDVLTVEMSGTTTATQFEPAVLMIHYDNLPGAQGRFIDEATLKANTVQLFDVEVDLTAATTGQWGGAAAINASFDLFKAETDYAILGGHTSVQLASIGIKGPDTGNLRVGFPGTTAANRFYYENWFVTASREYGLPLIPVINAANKAATNVDCLAPVGGGSPKITLHMAQLTPEAAKQGAAATGPTPASYNEAKTIRSGGGPNLPVGIKKAPVGSAGRGIYRQ